MISKERLEELIKEGATIYTIKHCGGYVIELSLKNISDEFGYLLHRIAKMLFETKKQAEWYLKYHKTRTEELDLPMWKEFKDYNENVSVSFVGEDWYIYELSKQTLNDKLYLILVADGEIWKRWNFTEKDYIKACNLCLKLFEGE